MRLLAAIILTGALAAAVFADHRNDDKSDDKKGDKKGNTKKDDPSQIGNRDVGKGINFYSLEKEIALGKQLAEEVARQARIVDEPLISEYVNRIGQNLARNSDARVPFSFRVIEGEEPNAFAFPGGFVFVYSGLIKLADEEDEFAGAVAHEIAHVAARHMTRQATKSQIANLASLPIGILFGGVGGIAARQGAGVAIPAMFLKFSRADESEADYLGTQYMYAAGYDPTGAVSIFEKIESLNRAKPGAMSRIFSTHPMDADRIQKTQKEIERILPARDQYVVSTSEYRAMRERLIGLDHRLKKDVPDGRPVLRRIPGNGSSPADKQDPDERPTVRRRDLAKAREIRARIQSGSDFAALAGTESGDADSSVNGGDQIFLPEMEKKLPRASAKTMVRELTAQAGAGLDPEFFGIAKK